MTAILGLPRFQSFLQDDVTFNAGGTVEAYVAGTTPSPSNLKNIYSNVTDAVAGTNPIANPFTLDSSGGGDIVCQGATLIIVKDAEGNVLSTTDYIDAATNSVIDSSGNTILDYGEVPNAVNYVLITNAAAGDSPEIESAGSDTNIDLRLAGKGTGGVRLSGVKYPTSQGSTYAIMRRSTTANTLELTRSLTGLKANPSVTQNILNNTLTQVAFGTASTDRGANYGTGQYVASVPGLYLINIDIKMANSISGGSATVHIYRNSSPVDFSTITIAANTTVSIPLTSMLNLDIADTLQVFMQQTNGSTATGVVQTSSLFCVCLLEAGL